MNRAFATLAAVAILALAGCSSESPKAEPATPEAVPSAAPYDREAEQREAFITSADQFPAGMKVDICDAAEKDGAAGVKAYMADDEYPFVVDDADYDSRMWVKYCNNEL